MIGNDKLMALSPRFIAYLDNNFEEVSFCMLNSLKNNIEKTISTKDRVIVSSAAKIDFLDLILNSNKKTKTKNS